MTILKYGLLEDWQMPKHKSALAFESKRSIAFNISLEFLRGLVGGNETNLLKNPKFSSAYSAPT